jgi:hypothetical protein
MKQITLILAALVITFGALAQKKTKVDHTQKKSVVVKTKVVNNSKATHNTAHAPKQVANSFAADYPNAGNVVWTKSRGNWTSAYTVNGYRTVATYHANGKRVDTRTYYPVAQPPQPVVVYQQSAPSIKLGRIIQIDVPGSTPVYQLRTSTGKLLYVNNSGVVVTL